MHFSVKEVDIIKCFSDITYHATIRNGDDVYTISKIEKNKIYFADNEDTSHTGYVEKNGKFFIKLFGNTDITEIEPNKVLVELLHYDDKIFKVGQVIKYTDFNDNYKEKRYTVETISETDDSSTHDWEFKLEGIIYNCSKNKENQSKKTVNFHLKVTENGSTLKENEKDEIENYSVTEAQTRKSEGYRLKL